MMMHFEYMKLNEEFDEGLQDTEKDMLKQVI